VAFAVWSIRNSPCTVAPRPLAGERRSPWLKERRVGGFVV
jgi:hypothetical protein